MEEVMAVCRGVVENGVVVLPENAGFVEGQVVEVRADDIEAPGLALEERFLESLLAEGLIRRVPPGLATAQVGDFEPIRIGGTTLSSMIQDERR
jgi:hypothetical protein